MSTSTSNSIPLTTLTAPATTSQCSPQALAHAPGHQLPGSATTGPTSIPPASSNPHVPPASNPTSTFSSALQNQNQTTTVRRRALKDWITSNRTNLGIAIVGLGLVVAGYVAQVRANNIAARGNDITSQAYLEQVWKDCRDRTDISNTTTCRNLQNTSFDSIGTVKLPKRSVFDAQKSFSAPQETNGHSSARIDGVPPPTWTDQDQNRVLTVSSFLLEHWFCVNLLLPFIEIMILEKVSSETMVYSMRKIWDQLGDESLGTFTSHPNVEPAITKVRSCERTISSPMVRQLIVLITVQLSASILAERVESEVLVLLKSAITLLGPIVTFLFWEPYARRKRLTRPGDLDEEVNLQYKIDEDGDIGISERSIRSTATVPVVTVNTLRDTVNTLRDRRRH